MKYLVQIRARTELFRKRIENHDFSRPPNMTDQLDPYTTDQFDLHKVNLPDLIRTSYDHEKT